MYLGNSKCYFCILYLMHFRAVTKPLEIHFPSLFLIQINWPQLRLTLKRIFLPFVKKVGHRKKTVGRNCRNKSNFQTTSVNPRRGSTKQFTLFLKPQNWPMKFLYNVQPSDFCSLFTVWHVVGCINHDIL